MIGQSPAVRTTEFSGTHPGRGALLTANSVDLAALLEDVAHPVETFELFAPPQDRLRAGLSTTPADTVGARYMVRIRDAVDEAELERLGRIKGIIDAWAYDEHVIISPDTESPDAISRVAFARRREGMDHAQFVEHYLGNHVPLVIAAGPLFRRYVVRLLDDSEWDAIVQQEFVDIATWNEHDRQLFEEKPQVREDLGRFLGGIVQYSARIVQGESVR